MQKITYTHTDSGQSWDHKLPKILRYDGRSTSNINEQNMAQFGVRMAQLHITTSYKES